MSNHNKPVDPSKPVVVSSPNCGPKSDAGKAISSRNSLKHGCCAIDVLIMPTENIEDYKSLETIWFRTYEPKDAAETHLVKELINSDWFYQRATRAVAEVEAELFAQQHNPLHWSEQQQRTMGRFLRYQTTRANAVNRCRKAVEDFRKARRTERLAEDKACITKERHQAFLQKNKPEPTWKEHLAGMRQKAIELGFTPPPLK